MSRVLSIIGVILAVAGLAMAAYGVPINGFEWGNTLIVAGATVFVGGAIVFALSEAVRQLQRIADGLPARASERHDAFESDNGRSRIPFPPKPEPRRRAPAVEPPPESSPEPRLDVAPSLATSPREVAEDRPPPAFVRAGRGSEPQGPEPRSTARSDTDELAEGLLATAFSRLDVSLRPAPAAPQPAKPNELFESMWPAPSRPEPAPEEEESARSEPATEPPEELEPEAEPEAPYAVAILKSGVIDGMAYTLYSDGSIEAELPQGTMRFASVEELRAYLDSQGSEPSSS